jgi:hypothetical protein
MSWINTLLQNFEFSIVNSRGITIKFFVEQTCEYLSFKSYYQMHHCCNLHYKPKMIHYKGQNSRGSAFNLIECVGMMV